MAADRIREADTVINGTNGDVEKRVASAQRAVQVDPIRLLQGPGSDELLDVRKGVRRINHSYNSRNV